MSTKSKRKVPDFIGNYSLGRLLGSGYSGHIFEATHMYAGHVVALKLQDVDHECPTNNYERHLYPLLMGGKGIPTLWAAGEQSGWNYLVIDLLGASLERLYRSVGGPEKTLDLGTVCTIAMQLIARLETMHVRGVLHRDIQLGNTVVGRTPNERTLYMIDFGFSKRYIDPRTRRHIPDSKAKRDFIGNYWFSSVGVHCRGKVPSRRDDMEAAALMLIHLLTPRGLSWTRNGIPETDAAHNKLKRQKERARPEDLCRNIPEEFEEFLRYCRSLSFAEQPDYARWIETFRDLKVDSGYADTEDFIWPPPAPRMREPQAPPAYTSRLIRGPIVEPDMMKGILEDLKRLEFNQAGYKQVLLDRTNVEAAQRQDYPERKEVIEISSGSEEGETKASRLTKLTDRASSATDNTALGDLVRHFVQAMRCNSSRTLTKEASGFLDALHKQLANPSVFVVPQRTSRQRSNRLHVEDKEPTHVKLGVAARLKNQVGTARSNKDIAEMVAEFSKVTNRSTGRTITKDGFGFLDGLAKRLLELQ